MAQFHVLVSENEEEPTNEVQSLKIRKACLLVRQQLSSGMFKNNYKISSTGDATQKGLKMYLKETIVNW